MCQLPSSIPLAQGLSSATASTANAALAATASYQRRCLHYKHLSRSSSIPSFPAPASSDIAAEPRKASKL